MGCSCEILVDSNDPRLTEHHWMLAQKEAQRIESKFSRYQTESIVSRINSNHGQKMEVDEETAALLDYAATNYDLSEGLFDITSGVLRNVWQFDGTEYAEAPTSLAHARACLGWDRVSWQRPFIQLPPGFEIDLGGICKEYAADKILACLKNESPVSVLVNLGGDIAAAGEKCWSVGIEGTAAQGSFARTVYLRQGALATSGTTKRFAKINGEIYGHILNPKTGWPVKEAPASVTVAAATCTEAGFWSTLAVIHGAHAETFLKNQALEFWCDRHDH
jgi:thiamine biosynthesis lipoprotein